MFKKFSFLMLSALACAGIANAESTPTDIVAKKFKSGYINRYTHGKMKVAFNNFVTSGDFVFRFVVIGPDGIAHKTKKYSTLTLPAEIKLNIRTPLVCGAYQVFIQVVSVTSAGQLDFSYTVKNPVNYHIYGANTGFFAQSNSAKTLNWLSFFSTP